MNQDCSQDEDPQYDNKGPASPSPYGDEEGGAGHTFDSQSVDEQSRNSRGPWVDIIKISAYSILGNSLKIFMGRLFGGDCDADYPRDFFSHISTELCITTDGLSGREGGSLFIDLPANIFGCFLIGLLGAVDKRRSAENSDQESHTAFTVGFCGSLTSFAGWTLQMTRMMYGAEAALGSQVPQALFGFLIGVAAAVWAYNFGVDCAASPSISFLESLHARTLVIAAFAVTIIVGFLLGELLSDLVFYRFMYFSCLFAPAGALLRWSLSILNKRSSGSLGWLPWGTLVANVLATAIASCLSAVLTRVTGDQESLSYSLVLAAQVGFAGALSTVSTYVYESAQLDRNKSFLYILLTILLSVSISFAFYAPFVQ